MKEKLKTWIKAAGIRAIKTMAQTAIATIGSSAIAYIFDAVPFVLIAFAGVVTTQELLLMLALQYVAKLAIEALFATPMAYMAINYINKLLLRQ